MAVQPGGVRRKGLIAQDQPGEKQHCDARHQRQRQAVAPGQQDGNASDYHRTNAQDARSHRAMRRTT